MAAGNGWAALCHRLQSETLRQREAEAVEVEEADAYRISSSDEDDGCQGDSLSVDSSQSSVTVPKSPQTSDVLQLHMSGVE